MLPLSPQPRPPCAHMTHHGTLEGSCPVVLQQPKRKTHREKKRKKKTPVRDRSIQQMMVCFFWSIRGLAQLQSTHTILWSSNNLSSRKGRHCNGVSTFKTPWNHARATWIVNQLIWACFKVLDLPKGIIATSNQKQRCVSNICYRNRLKRKKHLETWFKLQGCFLKWWYPPIKKQKWSFLVGKFLHGCWGNYHHFRVHPHKSSPPKCLQNQSSKEPTLRLHLVSSGMYHCWHPKPAVQHSHPTGWLVVHGGGKKSSNKTHAKSLGNL